MQVPQKGSRNSFDLKAASTTGLEPEIG